MVQPTASFASSSQAPDRLIAGELPLIARPITLQSGENLTRGAVLGRITSSGNYNLSLSAAVDGSETPDAILAVDTDASAADVATTAYFRGDFNEAELTIGTAHTIASIKEGLRAKGIWLITPKAVE